MAIQLTITDQQDTAVFNVFEAPVVSQPVIAETNIITIDNNVSTYYTGSKKSYTFNLGYMDADGYAVLKGFYDRQYSNLKYPVITITGADNLNVSNLTAKMTLNAQRVVNNCGLVEQVTVEFRESKQML